MPLFHPSSHSKLHSFSFSTTLQVPYIKWNSCLFHLFSKHTYFSSPSMLFQENIFSLHFSGCIDWWKPCSLITKHQSSQTANIMFKEREPYLTWTLYLHHVVSTWIPWSKYKSQPSQHWNEFSGQQINYEIQFTMHIIELTVYWI